MKNLLFGLIALVLVLGTTNTTKADVKPPIGTNPFGWPPPVDCHANISMGEAHPASSCCSGAVWVGDYFRVCVPRG